MLYRLPEQVTVEAAEAKAIELAIVYCMKLQKDEAKYADRQIAIITDCQSAVANLDASQRNRSAITTEIINIVDKFSTHNVTVVWSPAHVGIEENDIADTAAKSALGLEENENQNKTWRKTAKEENREPNRKDVAERIRRRHERKTLQNNRANSLKEN